MIDKEELRRILLLTGEPQELVDAYCEWYYGPHGFGWCMDQMAAAFEAMRQMVVDAGDQLLDALDALDALEPIPIPREKPKRPPKYDGPQNKGRAWTRQPPRLARSDCRKMRR